MEDKKVFFIGLNKTATTSLFHFFRTNGYKCLDDPKWWYFKQKSDFENYNVFTDGYEKFRRTQSLQFDRFLDLEFLFKQFPNEYFILQHRPIVDWLASRLNMYSKGNIVSDRLEAKRHIREDLGLALYWQEKVKYLTMNYQVNFLTLDVSLPNETVISKLETFLETDFKIKHFEKINGSSEFLSNQTIEYNKRLVKDFFKSKFYDSFEAVYRKTKR